MELVHEGENESMRTVGESRVSNPAAGLFKCLNPGGGSEIMARDTEILREGFSVVAYEAGKGEKGQDAFLGVPSALQYVIDGTAKLSVGDIDINQL